MAKKSKNKLRSLPSKNIIIWTGVVLLLLAILAQLSFNKFVLDELTQRSAFESRTRMVDAIQHLTDSKNKVDAAGRMPEARLQLGKSYNQYDVVLYYHQPAEGNDPESLQVTTRGLTDLGITQMNGMNHHELFARVPEAQACSRGFTIRFASNPDQAPGQDLALVESKTLADGRSFELWREEKCGENGGKGIADADKHMRYELMNNLEEYLRKAQSY